jgi:hypothetical protein
MPFAKGLDGWYYWTNTFYCYDEFVGTWPKFNAIDVQYKLCTVASCQRNWIRVTTPPHSGNVVFAGFSFNDPGISTFPDNVPIETCCRIAFFAGDEYVGYKLLRGAAPAETMDGERLSSSLVGHLQTNFADAIVGVGITTADGTAITSAVVSPRIHNWGIRHGSKRVARPVVPFVEVP